jgi:preprotein translocase subunit SecA
MPLKRTMLIVYLLLELTQKEKVQVIRRATAAGQITLLTRAFGRGIDFMCRDSVVEANGGVHVLQTFLSEELSEEVQIMGRTANWRMLTLRSEG